LAPGKTISIAMMFAVLSGMLVVLAPSAGAVVNTCRAKNVTQGTPRRSNLQRVIEAANAGDTIAVRYVCVGNFRVGKKLTFVGKPTATVPLPTLHANGAGRPLLVNARVILTNLKITGGVVAGNGGGILNKGTLALKNMVVRGNTATSGGGIYNTATLTLNGSSSVLGNAASTSGGGIENTGNLTMNGTSSVRANTGYAGAGIGSLSGTITLNNSSSVSGNTASLNGGGIETYTGTITLNDSSSVAGNRATDDAGGIINGGTLTMNDSSSVSGNKAMTKSGGGVYNNTDSTLTMTGASSVTGNRADFDDDGFGTGGGIYNNCGTLSGAVDGGNVDNNYLGTGTNENNIDDVTC
jgi:hypothetical protein